MALSRNTDVPQRDGLSFRYGLKAQSAATKIYLGSVVQLNGNYIEKAAAGANRNYVGIIQEEATSGDSDGDVKATVRRRVAVKFKTITTGRNAVPALGATAYLHDDETVTGVNDIGTAGTVDRSALGEVVQVDSDGVWVFIE